MIDLKKSTDSDLSPKSTIKATDCECIVCNKTADCFWPVIDPDIRANPHCRNCVTTKQIKLMQIWHREFDKSEKEKEIKIGF